MAIARRQRPVSLAHEVECGDQQARGNVVGRQDVEQADSRASSSADTLPECEPPRTTLGAPMIVAMFRRREASGGHERRREFGEYDAVARGFLDVLDERVVMAPERYAKRAAALDDIAAMRVGVEALILDESLERRARALVGSTCRDAPDSGAIATGSCHWRWPGVWSMTEASRRSGCALSESKISTTSAVATSQRRCRK